MNCLKCEKEIVETIVQENGSGWMRLGEEKKFLYDGENEYVRCPYCGAKNILSNVPPGKSGAMRFKFTRYED
jgi:DNA-directed RNA polymerase subunit RPC12/RpoP